MSEAALDLQANALSHLLRDCQGRIGHDNHELLAAVPCADVEDADACPQQIGDITKRPVAFQVATCVVHELEVVDVDEQQREVLVLTPCPFCLGLEAGFEVASVEQPRYGIDSRQLRELVEPPAESLACVSGSGRLANRRAA